MSKNYILLFIAITLSSGRSIFSKQIIYDNNNKKFFYFSQGILFSSAAISIILIKPSVLLSFDYLTVTYALIYGILLIISQWFYTDALKNGPTSLCAMIYSFGFILPTLSGALFWNEEFFVYSGIGILFASLAIISSSFSKKEEKNTVKKGFLFQMLLAMLASGGLGIMQKIQQTSKVSDKFFSFIFIAFVFAASVSFIFFATSKCGKLQKSIKFIKAPALAGVCFGFANLLNTILAGKIKSAFLFPVQNIGVMMMCFAAGLIIFKEKLTKNQIISLILGIISILVIGLQ